MTAKIAERALPPLVSARVAAELSSDRAAELAKRMSIGYLADVCVDLDPRKVEPIIKRIPAARSIQVALELVRRDEQITLGRLIDAATDEQLRAVAGAIESDEALVCVLEEREVLVALVNATAEGGCWDRLLPLVEHMDDELRARLAALVTEVDDDVLRTVVELARREDRGRSCCPWSGRWMRLAGAAWRGWSARWTTQCWARWLPPLTPMDYGRRCCPWRPTWIPARCEYWRERSVRPTVRCWPGWCARWTRRTPGRPCSVCSPVRTPTPSARPLLAGPGWRRRTVRWLRRRRASSVCGTRWHRCARPWTHSRRTPKRHFAGELP